MVSASRSSSTASTRDAAQIGHGRAAVLIDHASAGARRLPPRSCAAMSGSLTTERRALPVAVAAPRESCRRASRRAAARSPDPSPSPPRSRVVPPSACRKRSKMIGQELWRDADAGVLHRRSRRRVHAARRRTCTRPPRLVNFTAFDSRFQTTCCSRSGSPETGAGVGGRARSRSDPLGVRGRRDRVDRAPHDVGDVHRLHVQPHLAGDDPRHVEHVLDDLGERRRVALDRLDRARDLLAGTRCRCESCARSRGSR